MAQAQAQDLVRELESIEKGEGAPPVNGVGAGGDPGMAGRQQQVSQPQMQAPQMSQPQMQMAGMRGMDLSEAASVPAAGAHHASAAPRGVYKSRRLREYDDDQSQEEGDDSSDDEAEDAATSSLQNAPGAERVNKPNPRFKNYRTLFDNLLHVTDVTTAHPIQSVLITYDSSRAVTVTKANDREYYVKMYSFESDSKEGKKSENASPEPCFEEKIGGGANDYIKLKEVEQSSDGKKFAIVYNNDGKFRLRTFGHKERSPEEIAANELDINGLLDINDWTMAIQGFPDPYVTCTFISDDLIFVNLFHNYSLTHYHFIYDVTAKKKVGNSVSLEMECSKKNFPYKCFYNEELKEVYCFYRQGHSLIVQANDAEKYLYDRPTEMDLGQMYLLYNTALVARSSSDILFFKIEVDEITERRVWKQYHVIHARGFIFYIKGNVRIQITTDDQVRFYKVDPKTCQPELENVMYNYMNCTQMMFGSKVRYGITYKTNQRSFTIYRRKYQHNFKVPVVSENLEGSKGLELRHMDVFLCSKVDRVIMYDIQTFQEVGEIKIPLLRTETREPNEIIALQKCQNEEYLAIISGKNLIRAEQKPNQLFVYRKKSVDAAARREGRRRGDEFEFKHRVILKDIPAFKQVAMKFHFQLKKNKSDPTDSIIFAKIDEIFVLNFVTQEVSTIYRFKEQLARQPQFFEPNGTQTIYITASPEDGIFYDSTDGTELDIDEDYDLNAVKEIVYDPEDGLFYLLANKYQEKLGFFVLRMPESNPQQAKFLIKWKNKFDINDTNIFVLRNRAHALKELVISFKTIYLNVYNIVVMDVASGAEQSLIFRHESFQLWESGIAGFLTDRNNDFITVNRDGINVVALGSNERRPLRDAEGNQRMIHALEAMNFLKVDPSNFLLFACAKREKREVSVTQEFVKEQKEARKGEEAENEVGFDRVYNIKIWSITLRELLLFQSLYVSKTLSDVVGLVNAQPNPEVFYKSFLEFDASNMASILSFDSRSMEYLLADDFAEHFSADYPIFYKNKIQKGSAPDIQPLDDGAGRAEDAHEKCGGEPHLRFFYRSAIDNALRNNQVKAANLIINYIVKYQDDFSSSYLFNKNFSVLFEKGIEVEPLLKSEIFCYPFDYDEWPSTHNNDTSYLRPYNESIYAIRKHYSKVFPGAEFEDIIEEDGSQKAGIESDKIYKIKYTINLLPYIGSYVESTVDKFGKAERVTRNPERKFMAQVSASEELAIFDCRSLESLIDFKWQEYGQSLHRVGCFMHMIQLVIVIFYVDHIYIRNSLGYTRWQPASADNPLAWVLLAGILYPTLYESVQMVKCGIADYLTDLGNYFDLLYIWGSVAMSLMHIILDPFDFASKLVMIAVIMLSCVRTFKFLRIFSQFSPIVTMLSEVIYDLRIFLFFYGILTALFSLLIGVLGIGNIDAEGPFKDHFYDPEAEEQSGYPGVEYKEIGLFAGNIINTLKMSTGDFELITTALYLEPEENIIFWVCWTLIVAVTCIVFLNFIIAEASASYEKVSESLDQFILKEKAGLIAEAEEMLPSFSKPPEKFPKYIVIREVDN